MLIYGAFVRYNGIFLVIPFLLLFPTIQLNFFSRMKRALFSFIALACMFGYVIGKNTMREQGYIASEANQNFSEAVGLPMSMLSEIIVRTPEKMPADAKEFMYRIAPQDDWMKFYRGDFNSVKFATLPQSHDVFNTITPKDFFTLFIKSCIASPRAALKSFKHVSSLGWDPYWHGGLDCCKGDFGFYQRILFDSPSPLKCLCIPGFWCFLLVILCGFACKRIGWDAFVLSVPYVAYMTGTSLLLTGWDWRFFYAILVSVPPMLTLLLGTGSKHIASIPLTTDNLESAEP